MACLIGRTSRTQSSRLAGPNKGALNVEILHKRLSKFLAEGKAKQPIAAWIMTADRVREITADQPLSEAAISDLLSDLQHWGDPPIDDQMVEGVLHLAGLEGP